MSASLKLLSTKPQRATHTSVDTILISKDVVEKWNNPPFQRPLRVNDKVRALAEQIRGDGGVIPGVITIGVLDRKEWLLDGQHRREAFILSACKEGYADIRRHFFETMGDMGAEFVNLNSQLVRLRPDDILRGLEGVNDGLALIRKRCQFVGYDMIRRGQSAPIVSMSALLRGWFAAMVEVPQASGTSAANRAGQLSTEEAEQCAAFLLIAESAWGRDPEYGRLWGSLNMTICMWTYRRLVLMSGGATHIDKQLFTKCLMSLSADGRYLDWLHSRVLNERNRSPAYARVKSIFAAKIEAETGKKPRLPSPAWSSHIHGRELQRIGRRPNSSPAI